MSDIGPIQSKSRGEGTVLLSGDAAEDTGQVYEGTETFIAIGTQAGKVLVFNILGLLIHEIGMNVPVIALEWVGDMSASSILPNRASSLSPEPRPVADQLVEEVHASSEEDTGTVKKTATPNKHAVKQNPIPVQQPRDHFSEDCPKRLSGVPSRELSDMPIGSPLRVERTRVRPRKKSLIRPRIATETFQSPSELSSPIPASSSVTPPSVNSNPLVQEARRWPQVHKAPNAPPASRARRLSAPQTSVNSSEDSEYPEPEWTPPSTRQDKGKARQRHVSPGTSVTALQTPAMRPVPVCQACSTAIDTPSSLDSRLTSGMTKGAFTGEQGAGIANPSSSVATPKTPQRHVTIATPESSSPFDSLTSFYSCPNPDMFRKPSLKQAADRNADRTASPTTAVSPPVDTGLLAANVRPDTPSSVYPRSTTGTVKKTSVNDDADRPADSSKPAATPKPSSSSLDSLYSPPTPRMVRNVFARDQGDTHQLSTIAATKVQERLLTTTAPDIRTDSPSSVYSRSISGIVRDADINKENPIDEETPTEQSTTSTPPKVPRHRLSIHALDTPLADKTYPVDEETLTEQSALSDPLPVPRHSLSIHALGTPLSTSSPSSLYSRFVDGAPLDPLDPRPPHVCPKMASSRARENDAGRPRTDCSFDAGIYNVEKRKRASEPKNVVAIVRKGTWEDEMVILREDHIELRQELAGLRLEFRALTRQMAGLREEFRVLKSVLLRPKV